MTVIIQEIPLPDKTWNQRMLNSSGTMYQTVEYALFQQIKEKSIPKFLIFQNNKGDIVGQIALRFLTQNKKSVKRFLYSKIQKRSRELCRWMYGPIIFDQQFTKEIQTSLKDYLIKKNCSIYGTNPPLFNTLLSNWNDTFRVNPWQTFLIDLNLELDLLWKNMNKNSARKNIERSQNRNVIVKQMQRDDLDIFHKILSYTKDDADLELLQHQWDILNPIGLTGFLAYKDEIPIGGILASSFNGYINEFRIARTKKDFDEKLYSQDFLKWKIIEWGKTNLFKYYDLSGANPIPDNKKEEGILRYKKKFGAIMTTYNIVKY